ncbi:MAG: helix-turn-helix domain-containing protein [Blautia sp.]
MFRKRLGNFFHCHRLQKEVSQQDLAKITGLNRSYISALEQGAANITMTTLNRLAIGLRVEIMLLFIESKHKFEYEEERL